MVHTWINVDSWEEFSYLLTGGACKSRYTLWSLFSFLLVILYCCWEKTSRCDEVWELETISRTMPVHVASIAQLLGMVERRGESVFNFHKKINGRISDNNCFYSQSIGQSLSSHAGFQFSVSETGRDKNNNLYFFLHLHWIHWITQRDDTWENGQRGGKFTPGSRSIYLTFIISFRTAVYLSPNVSGLGIIWILKLGGDSGCETTDMSAQVFLVQQQQWKMNGQEGKVTTV